MNGSQPAPGRFAVVEWVTTTGSTNDDLAIRARGGDTRPAVRIADAQTAGRGRRDRRWEMPMGGGLLMSFFVPWADRPTVHLLPTALGVAAVDAIDTFGRVVALKWPNDLVSADGSKVGGMLSETVTIDRELRGVVCGLGCNVRWPAATVAGLETATALDALGPDPIDRRRLADALITCFDASISDLESRGSAWLLGRYRDRCATLGRDVRVDFAHDSITGRATDVDDRGRLLVEVDGRLQSVDAGDVVHLRLPSPRRE